MSASTTHSPSTGEWQSHTLVIATREHGSPLYDVIAVWAQCCSWSLLTGVTLISDGPVVLLLLPRVGRGGALGEVTAVQGLLSSESLQLEITSIWDHYL